MINYNERIVTIDNNKLIIFIIQLINIKNSKIIENIYYKKCTKIYTTYIYYIYNVYTSYDIYI